MGSPLRILALEPYAARSHVQFLEELRRWSRHRIDVRTLPPRGWKWRMRTASLHWARELADDPGWDVLFASDYLDLAELEALLPPALRGRPSAVYFHENQLTYPLRPGEERDNQYAFTHLHACLAARAVVFNSAYHRRSFLDALAALLRHVPDVDLRDVPGRIEARSRVLPLGTELAAGHPRSPEQGPPVVVWNHRWEYDKDPERFASAALEARRRGARFRLRLLGERFREGPDAFDALARAFGDDLLEREPLADRAAYLEALERSHVVVSTARHEFFGLGTLEALRTGLFPVLPDDLAYPEHVPLEGAPREAFLFDPRSDVADALERALEHVRAGRLLEERGALVRATDRCAWAELAPRYDALFEELAAPTGGS